MTRSRLSDPAEGKRGLVQIYSAKWKRGPSLPRKSFFSAHHSRGFSTYSQYFEINWLMIFLLLVAERIHDILLKIWKMWQFWVFPMEKWVWKWKYAHGKTLLFSVYPIPAAQERVHGWFRPSNRNCISSHCPNCPKSFETCLGHVQKLSQCVPWDLWSWSICPTQLLHKLGQFHSLLQYFYKLFLKQIYIFAPASSISQTSVAIFRLKIHLKLITKKCVHRENKKPKHTQYPKQLKWNPLWTQ